MVIAITRGYRPNGGKYIRIDAAKSCEARRRVAISHPRKDSRNAMASEQEFDFRDRIRASFDRQGAMTLIGAELTRIQQGTVEIELSNRPELTQQHGFLHAGVISAALDSACTYAAYTMIDPDVSILTIEFKVNLMSPGKGDRFLFRGEITKPGSNIIVADGKAYAIGDGPAKLIASMTGTKMALRGREDIRG
jgi:uncharacterized protein (TIGR00369 family)